MELVYPTQFGGPPFPVARITSEFELGSVTATLSTQTLILTFSAVGNDWRASEAFDISEVPSGTNVIRFSATDLFGNAAETNALIVIDRPPVINVLAPSEGALARPILSSVTVARDDLGVPDIHVLNASGFDPQTFFHNRTTRAEFVMDLSAGEESVVTVNYFAHDATRYGPAFETRHLLSLSNPRYQPRMIVPGEILEANADAVLSLSQPGNGNGELILTDRRTGQARISKTLLPTDRVDSWALTSTGALIAHSSSAGQHVLDLNGGDEIDLGAPTFGPFVVKGRFGLFNADGETLLRDFIARTNYVFPFRALGGDVAENGTAFVTTPLDSSAGGNAIYRFADGQLTGLTDANQARWSLLTDGTNLLWVENEAMSDPGYDIKLLTPAGLTTLATNVSVPAGESSAAMSGGWVSFAKQGAQGQKQIWLRSPAGEISQATFYSRNAHILGLQPDGSLLAFVEETGIVYVPRGGAPKRIGGDFGARYSLIGTNFIASRLSALFDLIVEGDPIGLTSPRFDSATQLLTYYVTSTQPASFTLQRSTNLVDWTAVTTGAVTNTLPTLFQTATSPGFFRLRKE